MTSSTRPKPYNMRGYSSHQIPARRLGDIDRGLVNAAGVLLAVALVGLIFIAIARRRAVVSR